MKKVVVAVVVFVVLVAVAFVVIVAAAFAVAIAVAVTVIVAVCCHHQHRRSRLISSSLPLQWSSSSFTAIHAVIAIATTTIAMQFVFICSLGRIASLAEVNPAAEDSPAVVWMARCRPTSEAYYPEQIRQ